MANSSLTAQLLIVVGFKACFSHEVPARIALVSEVAKFLLGDGAHVAQQVRGGLAVRIPSLGARGQVDPRRFVDQFRHQGQG